MTLNYGIFDVSDPQNPDRVYSAALLCRMMAKQIRDGIVHGDGNEMAVTVTDPPAMTVLVGTGTAMVQGRFCENDAALTLAVPAAHATYPRIDRVVVRLNASPGRTIDIVVKPGTAAPTPAAPALTRTAETWELSLAQVRVEAGATYIVAAKITDERANTSLCGVAAPVYVPSSQLEIVEGLAMQGMPLVGLPAPATSTAAATKAYVDSVISGFGISDITIDADKNWGGNDITNVGTLSANSLILSESSFTVSSKFVDVPGTTLRKTIPFSVQVYTDNQWNTLLSFTIPANYSSNYDSNCLILIARGTSSITCHTVTVRALRSGVEIGSGSAPYDSGTVTVNTTGGFRAGDEIVLEGKCAKSQYPAHDRYHTLSNCRILSSRRADFPILAHFAEEEW